tara:strand:- start:147 stop:596 length:450 start_codon:yes stop_codon:yes gene_type:complete
MLHQLDIVYKCIFHGEETKIIHTEPGEQVKIYPKKDGIKFANHKVFKYKFKEWEGLCPAIVKFGDKKVIMPWGVECHPKTTIDDIEVIKKRKNKPRQPKSTWEFTSSNGNGTYKVTKHGDKFKCNCMGFWRSKGNCKHVKEVKAKLNLI